MKAAAQIHTNREQIMLNQLNQKLPATDPCLGAAIVISKATHKIKSHFETISHIHASVWWFNTTVTESLNKIEIRYACIFCLYISGII